MKKLFRNLTIAFAIGIAVPIAVAPAVQAQPVKAAICYNQQAYHYEWFQCYNWGWGVPSSCWYIKKVCY